MGSGRGGRCGPPGGRRRTSVHAALRFAWLLGLLCTACAAPRPSAAPARSLLLVAGPAGPASASITGAAVAPDALPPCIDGQYGPQDVGVRCRPTGDTTPTARCNDGSFDYSRSLTACAGHGGVYAWLAAPSGQPQGAQPFPVATAQPAGGAPTASATVTPATTAQPTATASATPVTTFGLLVSVDGTPGLAFAGGIVEHGVPISVSGVTPAQYPVSGDSVAVNLSLMSGSGTMQVDIFLNGALVAHGQATGAGGQVLLSYP